jgi:acyl carrier protein
MVGPSLNRQFARVASPIAGEVMVPVAPATSRAALCDCLVWAGVAAELGREATFGGSETQMSHYEKIRFIVAENLGVPLNLVVPDAHFEQDLGASLDIVEMIMTCEEEFQISIPDEEAAKLTTVRHLTNYIDQKTQDATVWPPLPSLTG